MAVCSPWRFPSGCPGRALPGTVASWSPDFPRSELIRPRPSGPPHTRADLGLTPAAVNREPPGQICSQGAVPGHPPGQLRRDGSGAGTRAERRPAQPLPLDSQNARRCRRKALQRGPRARSTGRTAPGDASRSAVPDRLFRPGARSECPITPSGGIVQRSSTSERRPSSARICASGKGDVPSLSNSIPIEAEFTSVARPQRPAPACQARLASSTREMHFPSRPISQCAETSATGSHKRCNADEASHIAV